MDNYEDKSDFEINKAVAETLGYSLNDLDKYAPNFKENYPNRVWFSRPDQAHSEHKDYCNNPSDAWPIITENQITIKSPDYLGNRDDFIWEACGSVSDGDGCAMCYGDGGDNPLRAAMIVFLKMQEAS